MDERPTSEEVEQFCTEEVEQFCSEIWENNKSHNETAEWIRKQEEQHKEWESQPCQAINADRVTNAVKKSSDWKSPGKDKVTNFLLKHLSILKTYTNIIEKTEGTSEWLTEGLTYLLPKNE